MYIGQEFKASVYIGSNEEKSDVVGCVFDLPTFGNVAYCQFTKVGDSKVYYDHIHEDNMEFV